MATKPRELDTARVADDLAHVREVEARVLAGAYERIHADMERARQLGLIDEHGNRISKEWPVDMQPGAKRDFGG
jgi:hypothetical protein